MKKLFVSLILISLSCYTLLSQTTNVLPNNQGFEGSFPPAEWELVRGGGGNKDWEQSPNGVGAMSSSFSALFNNIDASDSWYVLRTIPFNFSSALYPVVTFDVAYARYDNSSTDTLYLFYTINTNGTSGWTRVVDATTGEEVIYIGEDLNTAPNQTDYFTPTNAQWETKYVNLGNYVGVEFIRFAFESIPDLGGPNVIYIDNVYFHEDLALSVETNSTTELSIYPNPSNGTFFINRNINSISKNNIQILNSLGQKYSNFEVYQKENGVEINLDHFSNGIYFLSIQTKNQKVDEMIVIK